MLISPTDQRLVINPIGAVEYKKMIELTNYTPSINNAIGDIALRYKHKAGAIIFSGMCDDGVDGCEALVKKVDRSGCRIRKVVSLAQCLRVLQKR